MLKGKTKGFELILIFFIIIGIVVFADRISANDEGVERKLLEVTILEVGTEMSKNHKKVTAVVNIDSKVQYISIKGVPIEGDLTELKGNILVVEEFGEANKWYNPIKIKSK